MFETFGALLARRAKLVLGLTVVALLASIVLGIGVFGSLLTAGFDDPAAQSVQAKNLIDQNFGGEPDLVFVVQARQGTVDTSQAAAAGVALATRLSQEPTLSAITSYWATKAPSLRSADGTDALILAKVAGDDATADTNATAILSRYKHSDNDAITVRIGGRRGTDVGAQVGSDLALAESIAIPLVLILLVLAFGSLVSALLPLAVSVVSIFATFAVLAGLTHVTSVSVYAINLVTALGLGLGVDYALFIVSRFREEIAAGRSVEDAVARTVATAGRTVAFSALTVAAALSAMLVFPVYFLKSFAYAGVGVVVTSALAALIMLPALLAVLGHRVNAGRLPWTKATRGSDTPIWGRIAGAVMRRPVIAAVPVLVIMLLAASPLLKVTFGTPDDRVLPVSAASHQAGDALRTKFTSNASSPIDIVAVGPVAAAALTQYAQSISQLPNVVEVTTHSSGVVQGQSTAPAAPAGPLAAEITQRIEATMNVDPASGRAQRLVMQVRALPAPAGAGALYVGGPTATLIDSKHAISSHLVLAGAIIVLISLLVLFLFTGSVIQPIRAVIANAVVLGATLGLMVFIFQMGHLKGLLGFTPTPTNTAMPVLLFCIAFGLSMDYEVFLMSRIKEVHDEGRSTTEAVTIGLTRAGRIVGAAAGLLAVSFFAFGTSKVNFIQLFGIGTGLAILIDATLVRAILLPASMKLVGEQAWWAPRPLRRLHRKIGLSETPGAAQA